MKKILLVTNDVTGNQNFINELMKSYEVEVIGYIKAALYKLKQPENFGLVIIEVSMPLIDLYGIEESSSGDKTGIVFYEKDVKHLNLPIIFWSSTDEFRDEIPGLGGCDIIFVKKDADDKHLLSAVTKFVGEL